jgi:hypothetical protein
VNVARSAAQRPAAHELVSPGPDMTLRLAAAVRGTVGGRPEVPGAAKSGTLMAGGAAPGPSGTRTGPRPGALAQWQSSGLLIRGFRVRAPGAPLGDLPLAGLVAEFLRRWYGPGFQSDLNIVAGVDSIYYGLALLRSRLVHGALICARAATLDTGHYDSVTVPGTSHARRPQAQLRSKAEALPRRPRGPARWPGQPALALAGRCEIRSGRRTAAEVNRCFLSARYERVRSTRNHPTSAGDDGPGGPRASPPGALPAAAGYSRGHAAARRAAAGSGTRLLP